MGDPMEIAASVEQERQQHEYEAAMADRDPVEVAADALFDEMAMIADDATCVNMIATALRNEATRAGEAMREAAAREAEGWRSSILGEGIITHEHANEIMQAIGPNIAEAIRALPAPSAKDETA